MKRESPFHCIYCGNRSDKYEVIAGPPAGIKGDYGTMECKKCGYHIIFRSQDLESRKKNKC